jgi:NADPH:quinone reductase-like Zn-dependent oxidoreductase
VTLGGTAGPIFGALLGGALIGRFSDKHMGLMIWWKPFNEPDVDRLKELIAAGKVKPVIDRRYPLSEIVAALQWVNDGHARGKVVITF